MADVTLRCYVSLVGNDEYPLAGERYIAPGTVREPAAAMRRALWWRACRLHSANPDISLRHQIYGRSAIPLRFRQVSNRWQPVPTSQRVGALSPAFSAHGMYKSIDLPCRTDCGSPEASRRSKGRSRPPTLLATANRS